MDNQLVHIRQLGLHDIAFAMELKNIAGWNQTEKDWERYLTLEPEGCFLAEASGKKAGTGTAISYDRFGWVGMVLVHPSQRRLGLGTQLLRKTISYLSNKGIDCIKLDATPMGRTVYIPLGFTDEYEVYRYERKAGNGGAAGTDETALSANVFSITEEMIEDIAKFDEYYFGAFRANVLTQLWRNSDRFAYYLRDHEGISGYMMAHQGYGAVQIGPWVARDACIAEKLFVALLHNLPDLNILLDVPCMNKEGIILMEKYGFHIQRGFYRMYLGENCFPGNPHGIYATSGAEKG